MSADERPARLDVIGLGNAIVDVIAQADERLLGRLELAKGTMTLIEQERMAALRAHGPGDRDVRRLLRQQHGRAAALGARAAYVGKVQRRPAGRGLRP